MRKLFANLLYKEMSKNEDIVLLTGDLGYGLWDKVKIDFPSRFFDVGSSEQLMLGMATGMAMEGKVPFVYSITPFLLYRPFEFIRNYLEHEGKNVKLVGGGRGRDYGYLGFSHWAEEDTEVLAVFKNIKSYWPDNEKEVEKYLKAILHNQGPDYINLKR